jgi:predicted nucleic acid-binding protein
MTLYLDTSVQSALFDTRNPERVEITREFFAARISDRLLVSELTLAEIAAMPSEALRKAMAEVADRCETVAVVTDADRLASQYIEAGAVSEAFSAECIPHRNRRGLRRRYGRQLELQTHRATEDAGRCEYGQHDARLCAY